MEAIEHSALKPCDEGQTCAMCHNNIVIPDIDLIFMLIPKSATQSLRSVADSFRLPYQFRSKKFVQVIADRYMKISIVRNPFERLVSCWKQKTIDKYHRTWELYGFKQGMPFSEFVSNLVNIPYSYADKHFRPMYMDLLDDDDNLIPDIVLRFEELPKGWNELSEALEERRNFKMPLLPHKNGTLHKEYWKYYDDRLIEMVSSYYERDLIHFGYEFETCH